MPTKQRKIANVLIEMNEKLNAQFLTSTKAIEDASKILVISKLSLIVYFCINFFKCFESH